MKKLFAVIAVAAAIACLGSNYGSVGKTTSVNALDSYSAEDWKPFNYVLTSGAGSNTKYNDIRTNLDYSNGKLTASGRTTSGGMGVSFTPEIDVENFEINFTLNSWQKISTDRWFGFTMTDVLEKEDSFNEVPFYSKHSESWSNKYGAGTLFALRPSDNGACTIQFNYIGIKPSYDADDNFNDDAGSYDDGYLGWAGYISTIQLCNSDWSLKTDYSNITVTMKGITENGKKGIAFEINNGYYYRTDYVYGTPADAKGLTIDETNFEQNVFSQLDLDSNGYLTEAEFDNFIYGSAWNDGADKKSIITYANYGDSLYALTQFASKLQAQNKRLYMSFMYKDAWDIREGSDDASFTINSVNGAAATKSETTNVLADKTVTGDVKATINYVNLHAGVYPSAISEITLETVDSAKYSQAESTLSSTAKTLKKDYTVVTVKAKTSGGKTVKFIGEQQIAISLSKYPGAKIYKVVGSDVDEVTTSESDGYITFTVKSSETQIAIMSDSATKKGCGADMTSGFSVAASALVLAAVAVAINKRKNEKIR